MDKQQGLTPQQRELYSIVVQLLSYVRLFVIPWIAGSQASLSSAVSWSLVKFMLIELKMPSNHLILCRPLLPPQSLPASGSFSNKSILRIRWSKDWSFRFSISPSKEHSGLISFRAGLISLLSRDSQESSPAAQFETINFSRWLIFFKLTGEGDDRG